NAALFLPLVNHKGVVVSMLSPGAARDLFEIHKLPVRDVAALHAEIVAHCRRHIEACTLIQVRLRPLCPEYILMVVRAEWPAILPLRIRDLILVADGDPTPFQDTPALFLERVLEPRDYLRCLGL